MQVRIGSGDGQSGVAVHMGGPGGVVSTVTDPANWGCLAAIGVVLLIVIGLIVLVIREYRRQKKK